MKNNHRCLPVMQSKDNHFIAQFQITKEKFAVKPSTMKMISEDTGIDRSNICRYVDTMRKNNSIFLLYKKRCPITKHKAGFYTTNPDLMPKDKQLSLF
jgi:DNA-binding MarR family transcriptional regulator